MFGIVLKGTDQRYRSSEPALLTVYNIVLVSRFGRQRRVTPRRAALEHAGKRADRQTSCRSSDYRQSIEGCAVCHSPLDCRPHRAGPPLRELFPRPSTLDSLILAVLVGLLFECKSLAFRTV